MDDKNKKLALKNTLLRTEIDKLTEHQTNLMRENIKVKYYNNRTHKIVEKIIDENLKYIQKAYENTLQFKNTLLKRRVNDELGDKDVLETLDSMNISNNKAIQENGLSDNNFKEADNPLKDKSNSSKILRRKTKSKKFFDKSKARNIKK